MTGPRHHLASSLRIHAQGFGAIYKMIYRDGLWGTLPGCVFDMGGSSLLVLAVRSTFDVMGRVGWGTCGLVRCVTVLHFSLGSLVALPAPGDFYGFVRVF